MPIETQLRRSEELRPLATPVDTFSRPAQRAPGLVDQLAGALSTMDPQLRSMVAAASTGNSDKERVRAQAVAEKHREIKSYQEAVDKGLIEPGASDVFRAAWKQQNARVRAVDATSTLRDRYQAWEGRNTVDEKGEQFAGFIGQFNKDFLGQFGEDEDALTGALPEIERASRELASMHAAEQQKLVYESYKTDAGKEVTLLLDGANSEFQSQMQAWLANGKQGEAPQFNADAVWARANQLKNTSRALRILGNEVNEVMFNAIESAAMRRASLGDPAALAILEVANRDWIDPQTGKAVPGPGTTGEGRVKLETAQRRVAMEMLQADSRAEQRRQREGERWLAEVLPTLNEITPETLKQIGALFDFDTQAAAMAALNSKRGVMDYDTPENIVENYLPIALGELVDPKRPERTHRELVKEKVANLRNPANQMRALDDYRSVYNIGGGSAAEGMRLLKSGPFSEYIGAIEAMVSGKGDMIASLFPAPPEVQAHYAQRFRTAMLRYAAKHPESHDANNTEAWDAATKYAREHLKSLREEMDTLHGARKADPKGPAGFPVPAAAGAPATGAFDD